MNREDIVRAVSQETGIPKSIARNVLRAAIHIVAESFEKGESVNMRGIGFFHVKDSLPRKVYCPQKGKIIISSGTPKVVFKQSPSLKIK